MYLGIGIAAYMLTLISGFVLYRTEIPYNWLILGAHKLFALAAAVAIGVFLANNGASISLKGNASLFAVIIGLLFAMLFVTGALLSLSKFAKLHKRLAAMHTIATLILPIIIILYLLM